MPRRVKANLFKWPRKMHTSAVQYRIPAQRRSVMLGICCMVCSMKELGLLLDYCYLFLHGISYGSCCCTSWSIGPQSPVYTPANETIRKPSSVILRTCGTKPNVHTLKGCSVFRTTAFCGCHAQRAIGPSLKIKTPHDGQVTCGDHSMA